MFSAHTLLGRTTTGHGLFFDERHIIIVGVRDRGLYVLPSVCKLTHPVLHEEDVLAEFVR